MKKGIRQLSKICLASGIILTQVSTLGSFSTIAYAMTENQVSDFIIKADKDQVKINENVVLTLEGIHTQDQKLEVVLPDGMKLDEKETAKLNEKNPAIGTIQMTDESVIQINKKLEGDQLGKVFLAVVGKTTGQYTITAKEKRADKEIETKTQVNVSENGKETSEKSEVNEPEKANKPLRLEKMEEHQQVEREGEQKKTNMQLRKAQYAVTNGGSVTNSSYFKDAKTAIIPADNAFMIRRTPETKIIASSGYLKDNRDIVASAKNPKGSVTLSNVGYYKGKKVTLKLDVSTNSKSYASVLVGDSPYFLEVNLGPEVSGEKAVIDIEYSFFDEEGNPLPIKTSLNYKGINSAKTISIYDFENKMENMYALKDTSIQYDIWDTGTYTFRSEAGGYHDDEQKVTFTTKEITSFKVRVVNRDDDDSSVEYLTQFLPKVDIPGIEAENQAFQCANDPNLGSNFIQTIPYLNKERYMKQLSYVVNADTGNQYASSKWVVTDLQNKDWTNGFTFKKNPDGTTTITAKPETLNNNAFYDNVYLLKEVYNFVGSESKPVDKDRLTPKNQYPIPFKVSQSVDGNVNHAKASGTTLVNYLSQVQVQHIDKETNQPIPNVQDTVVEGIITDPFRVEPIEIPGYQVVKNTPITGIFLPENQVFTHIYAPVKATLEANDFSTVIGSIPTNPEELKTFILKEAEAEATELPSNTDITSQVEVVDIGGLCNQIGSYTVTLKVKNVEKTITVNVIGGNLEFIEVPKTIAFENITIPSREKTVNRSNVQGEIVVSDKRENRKEWSVYVKQAKPLTSNEKDILPDALVYTQNGVDTVLNDQNYLVHSQKSSDYQNVHINWKDSEGIRLKVKPGPNVKVNETYQGELEWTLTDTPI
ncbi:MucBP domain-containing protein [Bacillus cytotoxicus]|uniref:MucBP domain-containing protein n=1 Tax=Bacillus cytotoxicus TaxID=580165 RepID=UPI002449AD14|nr:MucBP domain-containing protein [Bacillus cytotoxicus]MDH2881077.1 MucBP domain-containing protein [Bacillus cytotoxicus]